MSPANHARVRWLRERAAALGREAEDFGRHGSILRGLGRDVVAARVEGHAATLLRLAVSCETLALEMERGDA